MMIPMFGSSVLGVVTAALSRNDANAALLWGVGACGLVVMGTTLVSELPKHLKLDKHGRDDALIEGLIRDNLPRSLAWTVGAVLLVFAHRSAS